MDGKGTEPMKVTEKMPSYGHLLGDTVMGSMYDIRNTWVEFDGNLPHKALPFKGTRLSLVYFTRRGWLQMEPEVKHQLEGIGVPLPDESWLSTGTFETALQGHDVKTGNKAVETRVFNKNQPLKLVQRIKQLIHKLYFHKLKAKGKFFSPEDGANKCEELAQKIGPRVTGRKTKETYILPLQRFRSF